MRNGSRFGGSPTVAHILPFPAVGGTEVATLRVARAAQEFGFRSVAFHRKGAAAVRELFGDAGFEVAEYDAVPPSYRSPVPVAANSLRLARELRRRGVALVHCSDVLGAMLAGYGARLAGRPLLCHVRNRYAELSRRDRSFLWPVRRFAFVSRDTWEHFGHRVPARRGEVLYDGIEIPGLGSAAADRAEIRREVGVPFHAPLIGMVARVAPQKDYATLIDAAVRVLHGRPEARFMVVGDCSSTEPVRRHHAEAIARLRAAGIEDRFTFTGFRTDIARFLNAVDVFALSTRWEGLPLVILEAMAYGRPVVATAVDGIPEVVADGITGFLVPPADARSLAMRLLGLVNDADAARAMGTRGRELVAARFSRDAFQRSVARLYCRMLRIDMPAMGARGVALGIGAGTQTIGPLSAVSDSRSSHTQGGAS